MVNDITNYTAATSKKRGLMFWVRGIIFSSAIFSIIILSILATFVGRFMIIMNRSKYVEIAFLFDHIDLLMNGDCIYNIDKSKYCNLVPFGSLFHSFPDFSQYPTKFAPSDLPKIFSMIPGQNPYVFLPLFCTLVLSVISLGLAYRAFKKTTRRSILVCIIPVTLMLITAGASLGIAQKIYGELVPSALNKPMTVTVNVNGNKTDVTGTPSQVGIKTYTSDGISMLVAIVTLAAISLVICVLWLVEGSKEDEADEIRRVSSGRTMTMIEGKL